MAIIILVCYLLIGIWVGVKVKERFPEKTGLFAMFFVELFWLPLMGIGFYAIYKGNHK